MDTISKRFYKDSKNRYKNYSNEKLIMEALDRLLSDINELKRVAPSVHHNCPFTEALRDTLKERIKKQ